ncbi:nuclear transport factor 2 family protein [Mesobaculum littorinae]|nr:nuclear transport factor 2 family protein [Mesobaculum littorinae]
MTSLPDVIETYIDAYNRKDVDGMMACLSDKVVFQNIADGQITAEAAGRETFREMAEFGASAFERRRQTVTNTVTVVDTTLIEVDYSAVVAKDLPNGWKAGQELVFSGASAFRIEDGMIASIIDES